MYYKLVEKEEKINPYTNQPISESSVAELIDNNLLHKLGYTGPKIIIGHTESGEEIQGNLLDLFRYTENLMKNSMFPIPAYVDDPQLVPRLTQYSRTAREICQFLEKELGNPEQQKHFAIDGCEYLPMIFRALVVKCHYVEMKLEAIKFEASVCETIAKAHLFQSIFAPFLAESETEGHPYINPELLDAALKESLEDLEQQEASKMPCQALRR